MYFKNRYNGLVGELYKIINVNENSGYTISMAHLNPHLGIGLP